MRFNPKPQPPVDSDPASDPDASPSPSPDTSSPPSPSPPPPSVPTPPPAPGTFHPVPPYLPSAASMLSTAGPILFTISHKRFIPMLLPPAVCLPTLLSDIKVLRGYPRLTPIISTPPSPRFFRLVLYVLQTSRDAKGAPELWRLFRAMPTADVDDWRALCVTLRFLGVGGGWGGVGDVFDSPRHEWDEMFWGRRARDGVFRLVYLLLMEEEEVVEMEWKLGVEEGEEGGAAEMVWEVVVFVLGRRRRFGRRMGQVLRAAVEARMVLAGWQRGVLERWGEVEDEDFELYGEGGEERSGEGEPDIDCLYKSYVPH